MGQTPEELISRSEELLRTGNKQEALAAALAATNADPESSDTWWQLALVREALGDNRNIIFALRKTVELEEDADGAWAKLGKALLQLGEVVEAKSSCIRSLHLNDEQPTALATLVEIMLQENSVEDDEETISLLERLDAVVDLSIGNRIRLGNLHYRSNRPIEAINQWKKVWYNETAAAFNVGLGLSHAKISQDLDALDIWQYVRSENPSYEPANRELEKLTPKLMQLAGKISLSKRDYLSRTPYEIYVCPFDLLNISDEDIDALDESMLSKHRKALINEIELEDGHIEWMPDLKIDKSRAISIVDSLSRDEFAHAAVHRIPSLKRFLTHGDITHFTAQAEFDKVNAFWSVICDEDVQGFLGKFFPKQFSRCLAQAIENKDMDVIECLVDGRRWVLPEQEDMCFEGAKRVLVDKLEPLRSCIETLGSEEPDASIVKGHFESSGIIAILNRLPLHFEDIRSELLKIIRSLCLELFRLHQNAELSKAVLGIADQIQFRSTQQDNLVQKDLEQLNEIIGKENADAVHLTVNGKDLALTKKGVRQGEIFIKTNEIDSVRCGTLVETESGQTKSTYSLNVTSASGLTVNVAWKSNTINKTQKDYFDQILRATLSYIVPEVLTKLQAKIKKGEQVKIGPCTLNRNGIHFETNGWFRSSKHDLPWGSFLVEMKSGNVRVFSKVNPKSSIELDIRLIENAIVLFFLVQNGEQY